MGEALPIKIFADGADPAVAAHLIAEFGVSGFTTNPTLIAASGARDYLAFARSMLEAAGELPLSLEVLADEPNEMIRQARVLARLGASVFVKIPITDTKGQSCVPVIESLHCDGINVNVTAVFTQKQVDAVSAVLTQGVSSVISVFAGRVADTGVDPTVSVGHAVAAVADRPEAEVLWASCREVYNVVQASKIGCDIVTVPNSLLPKLHLLGRDLSEMSCDTVRMFFSDAKRSGYSF